MTSTIECRPRPNFSYLIIALVALCRGAIAVEAPSLDLSRVDTQAHICASYGLSLTGTLVLERNQLPRWKAIAVASAATLGLGLLKEIAFDSQFSWSDTLANAVGTGLSVGMVFAFDL